MGGDVSPAFALAVPHEQALAIAAPKPWYAATLAHEGIRPV
jgi:hypothetical protein